MTDTTPEPATPPVPLPPAAEVTPVAEPVAVSPAAASPYLASTAAPVVASPYAVDGAVAGIAAKPARNPLGLAALIVLIAAYIVPIGFFIAPIVASAGSSDSSAFGWGVLGGFFFLLIGLIPGAILAAIALVLAVISLFLKNRSKVVGIVTICLGAPYILLGLIILSSGIASNY